MNKIICMASAKGGSGKTILTATFAEFLSALQKKVLIVDIDASTNGLSLLYLKEVMLQNEHALSEGRKAIGTFEIKTAKENLEIVSLQSGVHFIPATYSFINTETLELSFFKETLFKIKMTYEQEYDYIFLDAQAGSDHFAHAAMSKNVSSEVVIVSEYDPLSAAGVERLKALFREDLTYNRTWVLLNKMLPDFVKSFSDFLEIAKYLSPIPWDAEVVKAYSRRKLALDLEYGNEFTLAIMQTLKSLFKEEISDDLSTWLKDRSAPIKEPLKVQHDDVLKQIEFLLYRQKKIEKKSIYYSLLSKATIYSITAIISIAVGFILFSESLTYVFLGKGELNNYILLFSIFILISSFLLLFFRLKKRTEETNDIEQFKIRREIKNLEEKLQRLESLIDSDPEDLIKLNPSRK